MCGIVGAISLDHRPLAVRRLKGMVDAIRHRGPDDAGYLVSRLTPQRGLAREFGAAFTDRQFAADHPALPVIDAPEGQQILAREPWNLFLGHRRLSIIDLTPGAHQPMTDTTQSLWLIYNGEIYNFLELREQLVGLGHTFITRSDTEVVLHAYEEWGIRCVDRFNGMFAFALWDNRTGLLHLARDRYGIKPLYYLQRDRTFFFASEIKAMLPYLDRPPDVDLLALNEYFSFQNTFSDRTLFEGVRLLPPGHYMTIHLGTGRVSASRYWDFNFTGDLALPKADIESQLVDLIRQAAIRQTISDVPVGCYLSGGMDSGTLAAVTADHLGRIRTFTGGFDLSEAAAHEMSFDERESAEQMANAFQSEHYECVLHSGDMEAVMPRLIRHLEDLRVGQCYPNFYIARLASKFVKVVLAGTGGDELFGGYPWRYAAAVGPTHEDYIKRYYQYWKRLVRNRDKPRLFDSDVVASLRTLRDDGAVPFVDHTLSVFNRVFPDHVSAATLGAQVANSLYFECKTFLHGLLIVEDKLSMAHSLETRVPFLDNTLVDFACRIPIGLKVAGINQLERMDENLLRKKEEYRSRMHTGKNILRQAMARILPPDVTGARKQGFSAPDESWFRGRAEEYIRQTLLDPAARIHEYLNPAFVEQTLDEHITGRQNRRLLIWSFLSFENWLEQYQTPAAQPAHAAAAGHAP
jgi:asparagine synthase (glutamine-hydrolysing)